MTDAKPTVRSASYLSPPDFHRLNWACRPIREAFGGPPYLVGSVLTRPDYRDIDLRLILDDDVFEAMFGEHDGLITTRKATALLLLNIAVSDLIQRAANPPAPIDFQFQSMTQANVPDHGMRNPMGMPWMSAQRIQLRRTKGWRLPAGVIVVSRPSKWGNPHRVIGANRVVEPFGLEHWCATGEARGVAVRLYREDLADGRLPYTDEDVAAELRGKDLACWCQLDQPCHADVLLELANKDAS
jgi:hypothetical protein